MILFVASSLSISLKHFLIEGCTGAVCGRFVINCSFSKISALLLFSLSFSFLKNKYII